MARGARDSGAPNQLSSDWESICAWIEQLRGAGVCLELDGEALVARGPARVLTQAVAQKLQLNKQWVLEALAEERYLQDERAAIVEFGGG